MIYLTNGFLILAQVPQTRTLTIDAQNVTLPSVIVLDSRQTKRMFTVLFSDGET